MKIKQNEKIMSSAAVPGQYPTIDTVLDPPLFSLDTIFKTKNQSLAISTTVEATEGSLL
jgi:hypothetical protein